MKDKAKPKKPKSGGRQAGTPNKVTQEVRSMFQKHGVELVRNLMGLTRSENKEIRLRATAEALNRGYGKPAQTIETTSMIFREDVTNLEGVRRLLFLAREKVERSIREFPELAQLDRDVLTSAVAKEFLAKWSKTPLAIEAAILGPVPETVTAEAPTEKPEPTVEPVAPEEPEKTAEPETPDEPDLIGNVLPWRGTDQK